MTGRYLTDLADVVRGAAGVAGVVELDGWQRRARGSGGYPDGGPWCVMVHHTASGGDGASDAHYCTFVDSARPLCNLVIGRDGVVYVCAAGATNTNGKGGPYRLADGRTVAADQMNVRAIGIECSNNGVGQTWPVVQVDALFGVLVALTGWYLGRPDLIAGHVDWTSRKIDPATAPSVAGPWTPGSINSSGSWRLADVLDETARRAQLGPAPTPEDEMTPEQAAQLDRVEQAVQACFTLIEQLHPKVDARALETSLQVTFDTTQALHPKVDGIAAAVER